MKRVERRAFAGCALAAVMLVAILSVPAASGSVWPQPYSVESLTIASEAIARCRIRSVSTAQAEPVYEVEVVETLKGVLTPKVSLIIGRATPFRGFRSGTEILIFVERVVPGTTIEVGSRRNDVFPLGDEGAPTGAISMDMSWINSPTRLLEVTRRAVAFGPSHERMRAALPMDPSLPGSPRVLVPCDERLHMLAKGWLDSTDPLYRAWGAMALCDFPPDDSAERLRALLSDPALSRPCSYPNRGDFRAYFVRENASQTLTAWRMAHEQPQVDVPAYTYVDRSGRAVGFFLTPPLLTVALAAALWRTRFRIGVRRTLAVGSAVVAGQLLALHWRSMTTTDDLFLTPKLVLTSSAGCLTLQDADVFPPVAQFVPKVTYLALASDGKFLAEATRWERNDANVRKRWGELLFAAGRPGGPVRWVIAAPHRALAGMFSIAPLLVAIRAVWRAVRSRIRLKRGLCQACGYDLRGAASERCSECGSTVVRRRGHSGTVRPAGAS